MTRALYRCLVWMHPPVFRREFAGEMLWIYDEAAQSENVVPLLLDGFVSLARQWLLRSGFWKLFAALAGALFQVSIGGALLFSIGRLQSGPSSSAAENPELAAMMRLGALTAVGLAAAVVFLVFWWRKLARRMGV
jgi:hypothetical protein